MTDANQHYDQPSDMKPPLPGSINVLTILTFIGCGIGALFGVAGFWLISFSLRMMDKAAENGTMTEKQATDMAKQRPKLELMLANKWPLILITLVGVALCLYGAIQMRKLKKEGFYVYVLGQVVPFIASGLLIGFATQFNGVMSYIFACIPVIFIILYANQLKYMK